jgi:NAD(P)-dependent dehydrogenase (short-subunit alcohol dehydrogenase family)
MLLRAAARQLGRPSSSSACTRLLSAAAANNNKGEGFSRLDGMVVVNCGAGNPPAEGHGIGASTSIVCARLGAKVVSVSNVQLNADTVTAAIKAEGNEGTAFCADVCQAGEVERLLKFALDKYGKVDAIVNSGVHTANPNGFGKITEDIWKDAIDINLHAHFQLIHQALPIFERQGGGNILHFTTIAGTVGLGVGKQRHPYAAGKAAAAVLTKRIGAEYARKNIRANVIEIGYCSGPLVNRAVAAGVLLRWRSCVCCGELAGCGCGHACEGFSSTRFASFAQDGR